MFGATNPQSIHDFSSANIAINKDYKGNVKEFQCLFIIHWSQSKSGLLQVVIIHLSNRLISNRS